MAIAIILAVLVTWVFMALVIYGTYDSTI